MSENQEQEPEQAAPPANPPLEAPVVADKIAAPSAWSRIFNPAMVIALLALALVSWQWMASRHRINSLEQTLGKRLAQFRVYSEETRTAASLAQENTREALDKLTQLEGKIAASQSQRVALEALYRESSRSRDEWTLADIEQILSIASQQLQLSGNVKAALIAMEAADSRLQRLDRPQFIGLRKAITRDIERLKAVPLVDTVGISLRLDQLIAAVDSLPLAFEARPEARKAVPQERTSGAGWRELGKEAWQDIKQLIQIRRMDQAEAPPLLPPSQAYFLRQNLKLRLLAARIELLQHNEASYKADLTAAQQWLARYFDGDSKATQAAMATLRRLAESTISIKLPDISGSLEAVRSYRLSHERGPR